MDKTAEFPGFSEKMRKKAQKESKRKIKRELRENERKNALPPFLMVRAGLFDEFAIAALIAVPLAEGVFHRHTKENVVIAFGYVGLYIIPLFILLVKFAIMNHEKDKIKSDLDRCTWDLEAKLPSVKNYEFKRMAQIMTKRASKHNPEFFNTLIKNPKSVDDEKTASAIIRGHIKSHPEDIQRVLDTFEIGTIPNRLYRQLIKRKAR